MADEPITTPSGSASDQPREQLREQCRDLLPRLYPRAVLLAGSAGRANEALSCAFADFAASSGVGPAAGLGAGTGASPVGHAEAYARLLALTAHATAHRSVHEHAAEPSGITPALHLLSGLDGESAAAVLLVALDGFTPQAAAHALAIPEAMVEYAVRRSERQLTKIDCLPIPQPSPWARTQTDSKAQDKAQDQTQARDVRPASVRSVLQSAAQSVEPPPGLWEQLTATTPTVSAEPPPPLPRSRRPARRTTLTLAALITALAIAIPIAVPYHRGPTAVRLTVYNAETPCRPLRTLECALGLARNPTAPYTAAGDVGHVWNGDVLHADCLLRNGTPVTDEAEITSQTWYHVTTGSGLAGWLPGVRTRSSAQLPACRRPSGDAPSAQG